MCYNNVRSLKIEIYCNFIVVSQYYVTEAENEYVIRGNSAVMKCKIPSFVADFVYVETWIDSDDHTHAYNDGSFGNFIFESWHFFPIATSINFLNLDMNPGCTFPCITFMINP